MVEACMVAWACMAQDSVAECAADSIVPRSLSTPATSGITSRSAIVGSSTTGLHSGITGSATSRIASSSRPSETIVSLADRCGRLGAGAGAAFGCADEVTASVPQQASASRQMGPSRSHSARPGGFSSRYIGLNRTASMTCLRSIADMAGPAGARSTASTTAGARSTSSRTNASTAGCARPYAR